jgi:integrase
MPITLVAPRPGKTPFWYIRGTLYGRTIDASTKARDKKAAQKFKERFELDLAKADAAKNSPATFRIAAEQYANYRKPRKWDKTCIDRLVGEIGDLHLSDIRQHMLVDAANELYPMASSGTKNRQAMVPAAAVLHYAAENNLCPYIKVRKFKEKAPEPRALSKENARILLGCSIGPMHVILTWLFYQGWRISDVLRLQWSDIDMKTATVKYHISKTDEWRTMPLHPKTVEALTEFIAGERIGRVFPWSDKSNFYRALRPFCRTCRVEFTPHMARHSFATWLANEGVSPLEIMEAGGWKDHKSVLRYAKLDPTRIRVVIGKLG